MNRRNLGKAYPAFGAALVAAALGSCVAGLLSYVHGAVNWAAVAPFTLYAGGAAYGSFTRGVRLRTGR